jgi:hypothetical protein
MAGKRPTMTELVPSKGGFKLGRTIVPYSGVKSGRLVLKHGKREILSEPYDRDIVNILQQRSDLHPALYEKLLSNLSLAQRRSLVNIIASSGMAGGRSNKWKVLKQLKDSTPDPMIQEL